MRQEHRAGEKMFVDYAGQTVAVVDRETGEERQAQVFVAVLGASSYTFAEATWTQTLPDWTASHVRAFELRTGTAVQFRRNTHGEEMDDVACPARERVHRGRPASSPQEIAGNGLLTGQRQ